MRWLKYALLMILFVNGLAGLLKVVLIFIPPAIYQKDFYQEYILAKAITKGINPYLPLNELAALVVPNLSIPTHAYPIPHPPLTAVLCAPLALLTFQQASLGWFLIELILLFLLMQLLITELGFTVKPAWIGLLILSLMGWKPLAEEIGLGQLSILLLSLLVGAWLALRKNKASSGGFLLGLAVSIKLLVWPLLFILIIRKRWRALGAAFATIMAANLAAGLVIGFDTVLYYYLHAGNATLVHYLPFAENYSLWALGDRLLAGSQAGWLLRTGLPPLISAPGLAPALAYALPLAAFLASLGFVYRLKNFDNGFAVLLMASILLSPIAWPHYYVFAFFPLFLIVKSLTASSYPRRETIILLITGVLLAIPDHYYFNLVEKFARAQMSQAGSGPLLPLAVLFSSLPILPIFGLIWLLQQDRCQSGQADAVLCKQTPPLVEAAQIAR